MSRIRVCFLGTPDFAVTALQALLDDEHYEVVGVITQPDRPAGRKLQLTPSPVKTLAISKGLRVLSPDSLKNNKLILEAIQSWSAEVAIVVAFGQILTEEFLNLFPLGAVNVHGSLLPLWRGAAPIQRSIEAGDKITGVSLQKIVKKLDAGDIIGERKIDLPDDMNAQELYEELARLGSDLLRVELMDFIRGNLAAKPQDESKVTFAKKIDKSESLLNWSESAIKLHNKVRAFFMGPGTYVNFQGKKLKIIKTKVSDSNSLRKKPGDVVQVSEDSFSIQCNPGVLEILQVQPESRNKMPSRDFLKSNSLKVGEPL